MSSSGMDSKASSGLSLSPGHSHAACSHLPPVDGSPSALVSVPRWCFHIYPAAWATVLETASQES